MHYTGVRVT